MYSRRDRARITRAVARSEIIGARRKRAIAAPPPEPRIFEVVPFINASGETIPAHAVMRLKAPTTVAGEMIVNVDKPDGTYRWRYLINGPDEVESASGSRGWGTYVFNGDKVLYDTAATPALDEEWGPKSGEWKLFQDRPGFLLDGRKDADAGVLWAMQVIPGEVLVKNSTGSTISAGGSGTATLFGGTDGGETTLGLTITARNRSSTDWKNDKFGAIGRMNGKAYVVPFQT